MDDTYTDPRADPTSWQDWAVFVYALLGVITLASSVGIIAWKRNYCPIRTRNAPLLVMMGISGILHVVGALVSDEHFLWLSRVEHSGCVFWNFWVQYFLGLFPWYSCILIRLITYGTVFSDKVSNVGIRRFHKFRWAVPVLIGIPLFTLFLWMSLMNRSYFDGHLQKCQSYLGFKIGLLIWIVVCGGLLIFLAYLSKKWIRNDYEKEFRVLWPILLVGILVIITNGIIIFLGILGYAYARSFVTANVVTLHVFSMLRLAGYRMYKAVVKDGRYDARYSKLQGSYEIDLESVSEVRHIQGVEGDFLTYCCDAPQLNLENYGAGGIVDTLALVDCYRDICKWEKEYADMDSDEKITRHVDMVNKYFISDESNYIHVHLDMAVTIMNVEHRTENIFREVKAWIFDILDTNLGTDYVRKVLPHRTIFADDFSYFIDDMKRDKARKRMGTVQLTDRHLKMSTSHLNEDNHDTEMREISKDEEEMSNASFSTGDEDNLEHYEDYEDYEDF